MCVIYYMSMNYIPIFSAFTTHIESIVTQGGYTFLFITTLLEGLPLIGMAIPGHITVIVGGFLSKIGVLNIYYVLAVSIAGAILGDYVGFLLGRKYGLAFIDRFRPYFFITNKHIEKAQNLLSKHTGKAMIIGRFSPITRPLMPFLVGASRTSSGRFWFFNTIGGVSWVVVSVFAGYIFGAGYHVAAGYIGKVSVVVIIAAIIIIWGYRFVNMRFHIFKRYELFVLILNLVSIYGLVKTIQDAWSPHSYMSGFDVYVNMIMSTINHTYLIVTTITLWVTNIGSTFVTAGLGIAIAVWLATRKRWRSAGITFLAILSTGFSLAFLKTFFMRVRPENAIINIINDPSFPSGHAAMAAAFFVIVGYLLVSRVHSVIVRELMVVGCVLAALIIGLSRIILNVHWVSDVVAGWSLGIFFATASILLVRYVSVLVMKKN